MSVLLILCVLSDRGLSDGSFLGQRSPTVRVCTCVCACVIECHKVQQKPSTPTRGRYKEVNLRKKGRKKEREIVITY